MPLPRSPWVSVAVRLVAAVVAATAVAAVLSVLGITTFRTAWGWSAVALGLVTALTASDLFTRTGSIDEGTVFGGVLPPGPDRSRDSGSSLTGLGAFVLVGLPVAVLGLLVLSL